ncbi:DUF1330 domain-containing protein [Betaproteobacteria bacterium PRO7]|nr:DUF1330 domain-containing protein [Burkholderiaceae bacterium]MDL1861565.1 DUF1330 domain-containing protein [Betaproteobacteria bacterium PRO7]GIL04269.1 MAG: hypothetical protein BroJett031_07890 [Betaproteobacteria bacterium]
MAAGYIVVEMKITDPERYREYMALAPATIAAAGGEYLARGGKSEPLEGQWNPVRLAILKFPSYEQAKAWYDGERYRQVRAKRAGATEFFNMVLVEGVPAA